MADTINKPKMLFGLDNYISTTLDLLAKERLADIDETRLLREGVSLRELERRGLSLLKLSVRERFAGLYGRTVVAFTHRHHLNCLPAHVISPGDIVGVYLSSDGTNLLASGIVSRCDDHSINVAFDETAESVTLSDDCLYNVTKLTNDVTYKRLKKALTQLASHQPGPASDLIKILFSESQLNTPAPAQDVVLFNRDLDPSQIAAVQMALRSRDVAIVHGPPGTGKTTTVVEIIQQSVHRKLKLLVCAPSNVAVDNLAERLVARKVSLVRLGHPARLLPQIQGYSLDAIVANSDECRLVADVKKDIDKALVQLHKSRNKGSKQALKTELSTLRKEMRQRESGALKAVMTKVDVVLATLTSADPYGPLKYVKHFDLVIIDECSQAMEVACWMGLLHGSRCVLVGDHLQLPPTVVSREAEREGLGLSLMERLLDTLGASVMCMLTTQYRMHRDIMEWASQALYEGRLVAQSTVESHLLSDMDGVEKNEDTSIPLLLIDTAACGLWEEDVPEETSKGNKGEADVVTCHVERLIASGVPPWHIGVISPYNLQVEYLRARLAVKYPRVEIKSVDGFQGREKEAVVISMVRSNKTGEVGFLSDQRRINVAVTRARRHLAVICDSECVRRDKFIATLVDYVGERGEVRTALEYMADDSWASFLCEGFDRLDIGLPRGAVKSNDRSGQKKSKAEQAREAKQLRDAREKQLRAMLEPFLTDDAQTDFVFSSSLSSRDRFMIHEISESLGLSHVSRSEGETRRLVVSKTKLDTTPATDGVRQCDTERQCDTHDTTIDVSACRGVDLDDAIDIPDKVKVTHQETWLMENSEAVKSLGNKTRSKSGKDRDKGVSDGGKVCNRDSKTQKQSILDKSALNTSTVKPVNLKSVKCSLCGRDVPFNNVDMHEVHCRTKRNRTVVPKTPNGGKSRQADAISKIDADDFDALINAAMDTNKKCAFKKCRESIALMGQLCRFCGGTFCLGHLMAEIHGCGDEAKAAARRAMVRPGVPGSGSRKAATKHATLQRQMDKKLAAMADQRKVRAKKKS